MAMMRSVLRRRVGVRQAAMAPMNPSSSARVSRTAIGAAAGLRASASIMARAAAAAARFSFHFDEQVAGVVLREMQPALPRELAHVSGDAVLDEWSRGEGAHFVEQIHRVHRISD